LTGVPVVVGKHRYEAGMLAIRRFNPDVIVLDDAFQHIRLKRDINLLLLDHRAPLGYGHLLPRGRLREPLSALRRAHALIFTRSTDIGIPCGLRPPSIQLPTFHAVHRPVVRKSGRSTGFDPVDGTGISLLKGEPAVAFAGLADNDQFFDSLKQAGCMLAHTIAFADHQRYTLADVDRILATARENRVGLLITTYKDWVKIEHVTPWPLAVVAVDVRIGWLDGGDRFRAFLIDALESAPP
jgi:tetraacyldisaccharide 4'-kinase